MRIVHKSVEELTRGEYQACYRANFGDNGLMRDELIRCRNAHEGRTISLWADTARPRLLAWTLLTPVTKDGNLAASPWAMKQSTYTAQLWVKWDQRGKGYGKVLMDEIHKYDERPHVMPHDIVSEKFFKHYRVTVMKIDRDWRETG